MDTTQTEVTTPIAHDLLRETSDHRIIIADGYDIRIAVRRDRLQIIDGISTGRRTRTISRADGIRRIVILSESGYVTLEAMRYCELEGISIAQYERDGRLVFSSCAVDDSPRIQLAQSIVSAGGMEHIRLETVRSFLTTKLSGQSIIASEIFMRDDIARKIDENARYIGKASSINEMLGFEGKSASSYWRMWKGVISISWTSTNHLPEHWFKPFPGRSSGSRYLTPSKARNRTFTDPISGNRGAKDPINSMLNYAYRVAETETRFACLTHGLSPSIGFQHSIHSDRDAMCLDILEIIRPLCDRIVLEIIASGVFGRNWVYESQHGIVRLAAPLTHMISERCIDMAKVIQPHVSELASVLAAIRLPDLSSL
jgi:CRISPR-associated endonuclease Cas1